MNDNLNNQLAEALKGAQAAGKDVYAFLQQQAPDLVEQLIRWEIWSSVYGIVFGAGAALLGLIWVWMNRDEEYMAIGLFPLTFGSFVAAIKAYNLIKVLSAPKLVVLENIADLIKKVSS